MAIYEVVYPTTGLYKEPYRTICLHKSAGYDFVNKELPLRVHIPHYEVEHFDQREFIVEFDDCMYVKFRGKDLRQSGSGGVQLL